MSQFLTLDVETANPDYSSICQIGIVCFENGKETKHYNFLINPKTYFDPHNEHIHGITSQTIQDKPCFSEIHAELSAILNNKIVITHSTFDQSALKKACAKYNLPLINSIWLDSTRVVRRTWQQFADRGYGLANVAEFLKIKFKHHDAVEDARVAGLILLSAINHLNIEFNEIFSIVNQSINRIEDISIIVDESSEISGQIICFTGSLSMDRQSATHLAIKAGATVIDGVTKKLTLLVVGLQTQTIGDKSNKHIKAEKLILDGHDIRIISEENFIHLIQRK